MPSSGVVLIPLRSVQTQPVINVSRLHLPESIRAVPRNLPDGPSIP